MTSLPDTSRFHVYLLMGQSNMSGCGVPEETDRREHPRIVRLSPDGAWGPAAEPLHYDGEARGVGPGYAFARVMAEADRAATIGLIPVAVGGSPLSMWVKGADFYDIAVARAKVAMKSGTLAGMLWHQGESDTGTEELATSYADRLSQMIADFRADVGVPELPVVVGTLGDFVVAYEGAPHADVVNREIESIPERVANSACVRSSGLGAMDHVHFDTPAQRELGRRYAEAMQGLLARRSDS
jgi:hypothetical protein